MVGEEHHRAAVRWNLDGTKDHALTGEFTGKGPLQGRPSVRRPMRLLAEDTR